MKLALIYGSDREGRRCDEIAQWAIEQLKDEEGIDILKVDPRDRWLPNGWKLIEERLRSADAFLILAPEYNHSFSSVLKEVIDRYSEPWKLRPLGFVSYGGRSGGIRAVEQLRQVFAELHTVCVRTGVSLPMVWKLIEQGEIDSELYTKPFQQMMRELHWWSDLLTQARKTGTYLEEVA